MSYWCENLRDGESCVFGCLHRTDDLCCFFCSEVECPSRCNKSLDNYDQEEERIIMLEEVGLSQVLIREIKKRSQEINTISRGKVIFTIENGRFIRGEINCSWEKEE